MSLWMWSQTYALCVQCFLFLVLKCPHVAKIGTVYKAQSSPSDSRTFIMQPDPERHITKLLIVCEHTHYFKKNSLYAHTHTHCWHLTVSWMSAFFSKKLVNIPRNRSCLNCHRLPLQHPYCTCVCLGVCVHACFNSLLSIVPARWDQFYIERSIISSYESFRQFNRISGSFIYKSKCSSSILKPLHKQDTAQEDANAPERQSHWFFSGDPRFTFDISKCTVVWLQAGNQKREVYFLGICFTCANLLLVEKSAHMQM